MCVCAVAYSHETFGSSQMSTLSVVCCFAKEKCELERCVCDFFFYCSLSLVVRCCCCCMPFVLFIIPARLLLFRCILCFDAILLHRRRRCCFCFCFVAFDKVGVKVVTHAPFQFNHIFTVAGC